MKNRLTISKKMKLKSRFRLSIRYIQFSQIVLNILITSEAAAVTKTSISSGNWNNSAIWSPAGTPASNDDVIISANNTITLNDAGLAKNFTVSTGGSFLGASNYTLDISGNITVNGNFEMNNCDINLVNNGASFILGPQAVFTYAPGTNSTTAPSLFQNGIENFHSSSTLIIKSWYNYTVALGEVVTGNFGNLTINSPGGVNSIVEWNQKNYFETHRIFGTLKIEDGWITLDKSGSISSTTIGNIILSSINSTFIAHSGTHPSAFTLTTTSITNNGGKFYGLNDGNGNITVRVTTNFNNSGNVKIINNSGVSGVSNGNAVFRVDGDFNQTAGDTRIIYNITTTNSGTFSSTIRNMNLSGGIFMGQSGCHTGGQINTLNITQDFTVNFSNAADKFRGCGLTSIGPSVNNAGFALIVGRNMAISGTTQAEFTSSASSGDELVNVNGDMTLQGCTSSFNYGNPAAAHSSQFHVQGNMFINGGTFCISRNNGTSQTIIDKDLRIANGLLVIKANSGSASVTVNGIFNQSGGTTIFHSNNTTPTANAIQVQINGTFRHSGGTINFDDNNSGADHVLSLRGDSCLLSGTGKITRAGSGATVNTGQINFNKTGKIYFERRGSHQIDQVVQNLNSTCELLVKNGNIIVSSYSTNSLYGLRILPGGKLTLNNSSLVTNGLYNNCSVFADSTSIISLNNEQGLCGTQQSAIGPGIKYFLHAKSVVEYHGQKPPTITGLTTLNNLSYNKYGILKIMLNDGRCSSLLGDQVFVRSRLELTEGYIKLNNHTLTIENGNADAIRHVRGFVDSDIQDQPLQNILCWKNMTTGVHEFPFGRSITTYLPVKFNLITGAGNDVSISTRRTLLNNLPYPSNTNLLSPVQTYAEFNAVDRWWTVNSNGTKADITFTYSGDENTLSPDLAKESLNALQWTGTSWARLTSSCIGTTFKTGTITLRDVVNGSHFVLVSKENLQQFELKSFDVTSTGNEISLNWDTENETPVATYIVEKSDDGINFYEIGTLQNNQSTANEKSYNFSDNDLPDNISYYRIKIMLENSTPEYSETKAVTTTNINSIVPSVKKNSVSPNPFSGSIKIQYGTLSERTFLEIVDAQGRKILSKIVEASDSQQGFSVLNLDYLNKGIYLLTITTGGKKETIKIIKNE